MKKRIALSIGHSPDKPGAQAFGRSEHEEASIIAAYVLQYLYKAGVGVVVVPTGGLKSKVNFINGIDGLDLAVEIHLNAANGKAKGSETLYYPFSKKGKKLAKCVEKHMSLITKSRGVKPGWFRGRVGKYLYFLRKVNTVAIITESYFIDSEQLDPVACGYKIAQGIIEYLDT